MATMLLDTADRLLEDAQIQQEGNVAWLETSFAIDKAWVGNLTSTIDRTFAADQAARDPGTKAELRARESLILQKADPGKAAITGETDPVCSPGGFGRA